MLKERIRKSKRRKIYKNGK